MPDRDTLLARYMVGRYRLGHEKLALYLAGVLFEKLIYNKLRHIQKFSEKKIDLWNLSQRIDKLKAPSLQHDSLYVKRDVFNYYIESIGGVGIRKTFSFGDDMNENIRQINRRLHNFRWLRNQVMHGNIDHMPDEKDNKKDDLINYIWCEFAPESFQMTYRHWAKGKKGLIASMKDHTADYLVRDIDEIDIKPNDLRFPYDPKQPLQLLSEDFENLFILRRKLLTLRNYLYYTDWLKKLEPSGKQELYTDILTTIDTTSGYIWLPLTRMRNNDDGTRSGILSCSVSILATPLDFRVYMDFGGMAYDERNAYYDFLDESDEYNHLSETFKNKINLTVFDVDWYSHKFNEQPFSYWIQNKIDAIKKARIKLNNCNKKNGDPITWNRLLHGYIINKSDLLSNKAITFEMIEPQLLDMIVFYKSFKTFAQQKGITI